jgi:hypothetical protein
VTCFITCIRCTLVAVTVVAASWELLFQRSVFRMVMRVPVPDVNRAGVPPCQ